MTRMNLTSVTVDSARIRTRGFAGFVFHPEYFTLAYFVLVVSVFALQPRPPAGSDKLPLGHPASPETQRQKKRALTDEVSRGLPRSPPVEIKRNNYIDDYVFGAMERDRVPHAGLATDQAFLRRAYLDLTGRIPDGDVVR